MLFTRAHRSLGGRTFTAFLRLSFFLFALFLAIGGDRVLAQTTNVTCPRSFDWAMNSLKQNPCAIASRLQGICDGGRNEDCGCHSSLHVLTESVIRLRDRYASTGLPLRWWVRSQALEALI